MIKIALLILLAVPAAAETTVQDRADCQRVINQLTPNAFVTYADDEAGCRIEYRAKAGRTPVFTDYKAQRDAILAELAPIKTKIKAGQALTAAQQKRLWEIVIMFIEK